MNTATVARAPLFSIASPSPEVRKPPVETVLHARQKESTTGVPCMARITAMAAVRAL